MFIKFFLFISLLLSVVKRKYDLIIAGQVYKRIVNNSFISLKR